MLLIFIYLIGYIIAYIILKEGRKDYAGHWNIVIITAALALFSWLLVIIAIIYAILPKTPPKWL